MIKKLSIFAHPTLLGKITETDRLASIIRAQASTVIGTIPATTKVRIYVRRRPVRKSTIKIRNPRYM